MTSTLHGEEQLRAANPTPISEVVIDGIRLHAGRRAEMLAECLDRVRTGRGGRVATANLDFFALARRDEQLRVDLNAASVVTIDGAPVGWLAKLARAHSAERYAGVDLVRDLCGSSSEGQVLRIAVIGSTEEVAEPAIASLSALSVHTQFVAALHPPFRTLTQDEVTTYQGVIASANPHLVLVALGCPKQERLIAEWNDVAPQALWIGIGGSLDFFAGRRKRAPQWAQRFGMEWCFRMAQDPRRLASRYLLRDLPTLALIAPGVLRTRFTQSKPSTA